MDALLLGSEGEPGLRLAGWGPLGPVELLLGCEEAGDAGLLRGVTPRSGATPTSLRGTSPGLGATGCDLGATGCDVVALPEAPPAVAEGAGFGAVGALGDEALGSLILRDTGSQLLSTLPWAALAPVTLLPLVGCAKAPALFTWVRSPDRTARAPALRLPLPGVPPPRDPMPMVHVCPETPALPSARHHGRQVPFDVIPHRSVCSLRIHANAA
ncbi:hypothetical protein ACSRUE_12750 [Sorangium sp. KYC3313]|uniref:hypothetical protein n=1 Tax=Sorangium sp. KYC3313 TaxID=3449740 RepID=UPI003F8C53C3